MTEPLKLQFKPGINRETTDYGNTGGWYDCNLARVKTGTWNSMGGWQKFTAEPVLGTMRSLFPWSTLNGNRWYATGTNLKYYILRGKFGYWDSVSTGLRQLTWAQMLTALAVTFLPLAGGTLTGSLLLDDTTDVAAAPPLAFDGDANTGIGHPGADRLAFITAGVQRAEFTAAGALDLLSGQMKFPATANPSSDANTLDDYEEGTWTPTLTFGNLAVGMTYANRSGTYCKVGRQVSLVGTFALSAKGSSTGTARLGGLPFTSMAQDGGSFIAGYTANLSTITGAVMGTLGASATTANLTNGNGNPSNLSDTNFANNSQINFAGTYHAT